ncbi:MAG: ROK family protein [Candidatus Omnitrophica bacterium]|nr:ROK family protein [Candidatus Omnitrophota bacterium]
MKTNERYAIGVGLNLFDAQAILMREDGKEITSIERRRKSVDANETLNILLSLFDDILTKSARYKGKIVGAGVALGGIVDQKKGAVYWPQKQEASYVRISIPFKKYLEEKLNLPISMVNDTNACAWAEYIVNYHKYKHLLYMFSGSGCGFILNEKLYTGHDGGAGELQVTPHRDMASIQGDFGFLAPWDQDMGIIRRLKNLISTGRRTSLIKRINAIGELSLEDVFQESKKDKLAKEVLAEAAYALGVKISFLINLLNPEVVIIGGGFEEAGDHFLEEVNKTTKKFSFSLLRRNVKMYYSTLGRKASAIGAAYRVFEEKSLHQENE